MTKVGTSEEVILVGVFPVFSRIYVNLWDTVIKGIFYFVCLFFFLTITGRNEALIVEFKKLFVFNGTFITCSGGSHHYISRNYEK